MNDQQFNAMNKKMDKILNSLEKNKIIEKDIESEFDKEVKDFLIQINSRIKNCNNYIII